MKWNDVKDFEGLYQVSDKGDVRTKYNKNGKFNQTLKPYQDKDGYLVVKLYKEGRVYNKRINRLVAEAFIPNPEGRKIVNHIDCKRDNNCASNLEWVTQKENIMHSLQFGHYKGHGHKAVKAIFLDGTTESYASLHEAEKATNIPAANIHKCCNGLRKTAGGCKWEYIEEVGE